jgi:hypothetical protein
MLEILALIFLTKNIGALAIKKGQKPGTWKTYTVLSWFGGEIIGVVLGLAVFGEDGLVAAVFLGLGCALASFFILKANLNGKPDVDDDIDYIGQDVRN